MMQMFQEPQMIKEAGWGGGGMLPNQLGFPVQVCRHTRMPGRPHSLCSDFQVSIPWTYKIATLPLFPATLGGSVCAPPAL